MTEGTTFPVFILLTTLVSLTLFLTAFRLSKNHLILISVPSLGMFSICLLISFAYSFTYHLDINFKTFLMLSSFFVIIFLIDLFVRITFSSSKSFECFSGKFNFSSVFAKGRSINPAFLVFLTLFSLLISLLFYSEARVQLNNIGYAPATSLSTFLSNYRDATTNNKASPSFLLTQLITFQKCLALVIAYYIISQFFSGQFHCKTLLAFGPLIGYFFTSLLSGGRSGLLAFFSFIIFSFLYQLGKAGTISRKTKKRIIKMILFTGIAFAALFFGYGYFFRGSSNLFSSVFNYSGETINAFDNLVQSTRNEPFLFGSHTLYSLYSFLKKIGFNVPVLPNSYLTFVTTVNGIKTNIYGAFGRWIIDYGYLGSLSLCVFWSTLFSLFYSLMDKNNKNDFLGILISYVSLPLLCLPIEDLFYTTFGINIIYTIGYFWLILLVLKFFVVTDQKSSEKNLSIYDKSLH